MKKISLTFIVIILLLSFSSNFLLADQTSDSDPDPLRPSLIKINDLRDTARLAQSRKLPLLIMFGTDECPYCELLREDFLIPMLISGDYSQKIIMREAHVAPGADIIDFLGKKITMDEFSRRYGVTLFPTMVFVDSNGQALIKNIIGITTPSLFGGTLDDSIDKALLMLLLLTRERERAMLTNKNE